MTPHTDGCHRGEWLRREARGLGAGLLVAVLLLREGPPCTCPAAAGLFGAEQSPGVTPGAQVPPTGMNTEVGGASPT